MRSQFSIESVQMHALTSMAFEETLGEATSLAYLAYLMVCLNGKSSPPKKYEVWTIADLGASIFSPRASD